MISAPAARSPCPKVTDRARHQRAYGAVSGGDPDAGLAPGGAFLFCLVSHVGKAPFEWWKCPMAPQVLWPDHCVQGSQGAAFHQDLDTDRADLIIRKGYNPAIDSYSAFFENDHATPTGTAWLSADARDRRSDHGGAGHRFLRQLLGGGCGTAGISRDGAAGSVRGIDLDGSLDARLRACGRRGCSLRERPCCRYPRLSDLCRAVRRHPHRARTSPGGMVPALRAATDRGAGAGDAGA